MDVPFQGLGKLYWVYFVSEIGFTLFQRLCIHYLVYFVSVTMFTLLGILFSGIMYKLLVLICFWDYVYLIGYTLFQGLYTHY